MCLVFKQLKSIKKKNLIENKSISVVNKGSRQMLCYGRRVVERWSTFFFEFDHQVHFEQGIATNESDRGGYLSSLIR